MPMTLNVGLCRKVGEVHFGSRSATVNFAVEIEASHVREPEQLREKIRYLFGLAREAVAEELNGHDAQAANGHTVNGHTVNGHAADTVRTASVVGVCTHAVTTWSRLIESWPTGSVFISRLGLD